MENRRPLSNLGIIVYALGAIALGISGFVWRDFATNWQRVPENFSGREALALITAACELLAGIAVCWRRTARIAAIVLTALYSIFTLLWIVQGFRAPLVYDGWGNVFEELSLVIAGLVIYATCAPPVSKWAGKAPIIARFLGVSSISFGIVHFVSLRGAATWVPKYLPLSGVFWVAATGICFFLAAAAILTGILDAPAGRLLTAEIFLFELLIWVPKFVSAPHMHFMWAGNSISIAISGAAWVVSDAISARRRS